VIIFVPGLNIWCLVLPLQLDTTILQVFWRAIGPWTRHSWAFLWQAAKFYRGIEQFSVDSFRRRQNSRAASVLSESV